VVFTDPGRDLALLRLARMPACVEPLALAKNCAGPGQDVHCIGSSMEGSLWARGNGRVRHVETKELSLDRSRRGPVRIVETEAPLTACDRGAPVVNDQGELVGATIAGGACLDVQEVRTMLSEYAKSGRLRMAEPEAEERLVKIFPTQSRYRMTAARAIERIGVDDLKVVEAPLRQALRDADPKVRVRATATVGSLGAKAAPLAIDLAYLCKDPAMGRASADALVKMGAAAVPALAKHLEDSDRGLVLVIIDVLARMGPSARSALQPLRNCRVWFAKDRNISQAALDAISRIGEP
jgi:hypothetical protein